MTDKPDGKRWGTWAGIALALFAAYMGAYYATYTPYRGPKIGLAEWEPYTIGAWAIPQKFACPIFAPAGWIDRKVRRIEDPE